MFPDSKVSVESFAQHCNGQMIPLNKSLSYFSVIPLEDSDLQRLIYDPASAAPPKLLDILPNLRIVVVAYLEKPAKPQEKGGPLVAFRPPAKGRRLYSTVVDRDGGTFVFLAIKDEDIADYHDTLYYELASLLAKRAGKEVVEPYAEVLREELSAEARGEIDTSGWKLKEQILTRQNDASRNTKLFRSYCQQSLTDTLALYLHGLCCDIDVEAGPKQLPSRLIRRRLNLLRELLPPPAGVALFPEELPELA
jgi:hypothetical protein